MEVFTYKVLGAHVMIRPEKREEVTAGGIVLPEQAREKAAWGTVVVVGTGRQLDDGSFVPMLVKVGDKILFDGWAVTEVQHKGEKLLVIPQDSIVVVEQPVP